MSSSQQSYLEGWLKFFSEAELPILRHTARQLASVRGDLERVNGRDITAIVLHDPLLALRVLAFIQEFRSRHLHREITNIAHAVLMLGVEPFFRKFDQPLTLEAKLSDKPAALLGVLQVIVRTQRASRYAHEWAFARYDLNVEEVALAALLHDTAEILLWCFAPEQAMDIQGQLRADKSLRSAHVQQQVLGFSLADLQLALCHAWHLPELLITLMDDANAHLPRVQNVKLAVDLARHSVDGWSNPAIPDDLAAIQRLLNVDYPTLLERLQLTPEMLEAPPVPAEKPVKTADMPTRTELVFDALASLSSDETVLVSDESLDEDLAGALLDMP
ncbi:MAG TPA: HDOD domain-containing protein [Accumulibacter sp.]|nr:HDOD domain-containing protein [Accumulibacter sp.]HMW16738.1 HDOD domain-containing protein [Accumulibacter sp.]HMX21526.1 HDOD domain-containing protein [Accumulibacter sp.]HMY06277.1 HDOD domain-containing protein [Accumulibacter sp.]HNC18247.1 HDOD domain-containing protein [Accumulibacter sp.]